MLTASFSTLLSLLTNYQFSQSPLELHEANTPQAQPPPTAASLTFSLRHVHAVSRSSNIIFQDVPPSYSALSTHSVKTRPTRVHRPSSQANFHRARSRSMHHEESEKLDWDEDEVPGPDVEDRETLLELAKMTNNAYIEDRGDATWYNLSDRWRNVSQCLQ